MNRLRTIVRVAVCACLALTFAHSTLTFAQMQIHHDHQAQTPVFASGRTIGVPFNLVASNGVSVSDKTYDGKWRVVFFGYTHCPDVCPATLAALGAALDQMGEGANKIQPIFITLDPRRDTPQTLTSYMSHFNPRLVALTGTDAQIASTAKVFGIRFNIVGDVTNGNYVVNHPAVLFLFDSRDNFVTLIPGGATSGEIKKTIDQFMVRYG